MNRYILDTSALIPANKTYYDPEFCPGFWEWVRDAVQHGILEIVEPVANQIENQDNELWKYMKQIGCQQSILLDDDDVFIMMGEVSHYLAGNFHYLESAKTEFLSGIFPQLIGYAKANNAIIVTLEKSDRTSRDVVKLPDLCHDLNVPWIDPFEMLRRERPRFILER